MNLKETMKKMETLGFTLDLDESEGLEEHQLIFSKEGQTEDGMEYCVGIVVAVNEDMSVCIEWIEIEPHSAETNNSIPLTIRDMEELKGSIMACNEELKKIGISFIEGYKDDYCNLYFERREA